MSSSSNLVNRAKFTAMVRMQDSKVVLINLQLVQYIEPLVSGARLHFDGQHVDVKDYTVDTLNRLLDP